MELWQLRQRQSLPRDVKPYYTEIKLQQWKEYWWARGKDIMLSFSGGLQSTVLKHIAEKTLGNSILYAFSNTRNEHPKNIKFVRTHKNVEWVYPDLTPEEVIIQKGYPVISKKVSRYARDLQGDPERNQATRHLRETGYTRDGKYSPTMKMPELWKFLSKAPFNISEECCEVLKKQPLKKLQKKFDAVAVIGEIAEEGQERERRYLEYGCNAFDTDEPLSRPLGFWTQQDILHYIVENKVEYSEAYGKIVTGKDGKLTTTGEKRTGCMMCGLGCHLEKCPNRFHRMQPDYPKMYDYFIGGGEFNKDGLWIPNSKGLGYGFVLDYINGHLKPKKWINYWGYSKRLEDCEQMKIS